MLLHTHALFRTSLARLLEAELDFELAGECGEMENALAMLAATAPDVVIFEFDVWRDFVPAAVNAGYQGRFLAIGDDIDPAACIRALRRGVSGLVPGSESLSRLVQAIHVVASGAAWVDQRVIQLLVERYPNYEDLRMESLTGREQAVLRGILGGLTNRKIADRIGTSEGTVKATLQHLFHKTGVRTRSQLVRIMLAGAPLQEQFARLPVRRAAETPD
jgi:DNA-binding NarL/FixJ family response regulator